MGMEWHSTEARLRNPFAFMFAGFTMWIGGRKSVRGNNFIWQTNQGEKELTFTAWNDGEPNNLSKC